ncbi:TRANSCRIPTION FACTOR MYB51-LIKE ISOFORM X1 [Salix purpurea]|uniref:TRANSCRIPTION FACTOR MYB51-LIKE ISOFORM X1 n=1 Tax=Salix purpurea TaxID=77065 RepID=A0A9Q0PE85_SALPP|nr:TRANSCRIPTION FACTOR MYB51-LIKE ISOFORM X1 [Salix purpurea]
MGRAPCCSKVGLHRGPWTPREDALLTNYIQEHGEGHWRSLPKKSGRTDNEIKNHWNTHLSKRLRSQGTDPSTHKKLPQPVKHEARRRKGSNGTKNTSGKKQRKGRAKPVPAEKHKVHLPKAVRFASLSLPRNDSFGSSTVTSLSPSQVRDPGCGFRTEVAVDVLWGNLKDSDHGGVSFFVGDADHGLVNGSDLECQSLVPTTSTLEKLYQEYLQVLNTNDHHDQVELNSFAESLLA